MSTATLPRINTDRFTDPMVAERQKLLADAASKLGYKIANPHSLLFKLLSIGIVPFQTAAVEAYKKSKEKKGIWSGTVECLWHIAGCLATAPLISWLGYWAFPKPESGLVITAATVTIVLGIAWVIAAFLLIPHCIDEWGTGTRSLMHWSSSYLNHTDRMVPDHVLNTALTIKDAIPDANFQVVSLVQDHEVNLPDPFLLVTLGSEQYYVEQWDEKDQPRIDE